MVTKVLEYPKFGGKNQVYKPKTTTLQDEEILNRMLNAFYLSSIDNVKNTRALQRLIPYYLLCYYFRVEKGYSLPSIKRMFGKVCHSTIINGVKKAEMFLKDKNIKQKYDSVFYPLFIYNTLDPDKLMCYACTKYKHKNDFVYKQGAGKQATCICKSCSYVQKYC